MKRKIYEKLLEWKRRDARKVALLIDGARRVGKSWIAEEFGINNTARLPIDPAVSALVDAGNVEEVNGEQLAAFADDLERGCGLWH